MLRVEHSQGSETNTCTCVNRFEWLCGRQNRTFYFTRREHNYVDSRPILLYIIIMLAKTSSQLCR